MSALTAQAQSVALGAYNNNYRRFIIFNDGLTLQVEPLPPKNFKIGGNLLAYNDNMGNFKVHYKKEIVKLQDGFVTEEDYWVTDNLMFYRMGMQLKVFDNGKTLTLSANTNAFSGNDSIIAWYDQVMHSLRCYYDGELVTLLDGLVSNTEQVSNFKTGDNILAYVDNNNYFRIFYHGEDIEMLPAARALDYKVGRNIVGYWNGSYNEFNVFYKGKDYLLDEYAPASFKAGRDMLAYIDNVGEFKAFYDGEIYTVSAYEPQWYGPQDDLLIYSEQGAFKIFWKGKVYYIENYVPESFKVNNGNLAYLTQQGRLKAFVNGNVVELSTEQVISYAISKHTIQYELSNNTNKVYWNGTTY